MKIAKLGKSLSWSQQWALQSLSLACRRSILAMVTNAQSGHPGGSLGAIDYLAVLYSMIIAQTGETVVVSNGHISPAVYAILAELGYVDKETVLNSFRKIGSIFEGHVTRLVPGICYGTGPLGTGVSAASGFALAEKINHTGKKVYALMGDGEFNEGQVHEMINFANKYRLDNLILFVDYNRVQLSDALHKVMPVNIAGTFNAAGWLVLEFDGNNHQQIWKALSKANANKSGKPVVLIGKTIMGYGVEFMQKEGEQLRSTWHGKAPKPEDTEKALAKIPLQKKDLLRIAEVKKLITWKPVKPVFTENLTELKVKVGKPRIYAANELTDCRTAYGNALKDLAELNKDLVALTADLAESVKTAIMAEEFPERHFDCGIAEQQMISAAGGLSLAGKIPFASTFGAFISSRAKDQARVNDINHTNVKMVATHCGLSVGEDGPTHQAIDDQGSFLGMFNTMTVEPCDPNQTDRMIRFVAKHYGNFYVRMGRHKIPVLTDRDGKIIFDQNYQYYYGRTDLIRAGKLLTIAASGPMVSLAVKVVDELFKKGIEVELIAVSSIKKFDETLFKSIKKTGKLIVLEDHNPYSGLAGQLAAELVRKKMTLKAFEWMGVTAYQLSGKPEELYDYAKIGVDDIMKRVKKLLKK